MPRSRYDEDDEDDDWGGEDHYDDDGPATVPCPYCRAELLEDAEQCPRCGSYISREDTTSSGLSGPWIIVMLLALFAVTLWVFGR